jgi:molybdate transport system permease protein
MTAAEWQIAAFTVEMAVLSTVLILPFGVALAWCLARLRWRGKTLVETCVAFPLVLPPVVTGLVLLKLCGRRGPVGHFLYSEFHFDIVFTWRAVALALAVMSFPLLVWTARSAIEEVNPALEQIARTLGAGEWRVFFTITLPLAKRGILAGTVLAFARALGEFGATIMVAGNIPGVTTTLSTGIYQLVQAGEDNHAWTLAGVSLALAFAAVWINVRLMRRSKR